LFSLSLFTKALSQHHSRSQLVFTMFESLLFFAAAVIAATPQSAWGQCGGQGWTGATTCVDGYVCTASNSWYSQCIPGTAAATTLATSVVPTVAAPGSSSAVSSTVSSSKTSVPSAVTGTKYLITFGDSYSQTGFEITGTAPSAADPLGNPNAEGYTTDNGLNWIGVLVEQLNTSLTLSYNFAYGGATTDASLVTPYESSVLSLVDQVKEFTSNIASGPWKADNTLFGIWMGVNDVGNAWGNSDWSTLLTEIMTQYFAQVQILYNAGGRNFLFLTVPPTWLTPMFIADGSSTQSGVEAAVKQYNADIVSKAAAFESANPGSKTWVYDTTTAFMTAINNPTKYGAPNATCYNSDGVSCLWWNNYHPGQAIQKLVAEGVAALLKGIFF